MKLKSWLKFLSVQLNVVQTGSKYISFPPSCPKKYLHWGKLYRTNILKHTIPWHPPLSSFKVSFLFFIRDALIQIQKSYAVLNESIAPRWRPAPRFQPQVYPEPLYPSNLFLHVASQSAQVLCQVPFTSSDLSVVLYRTENSHSCPDQNRRARLIVRLAYPAGFCFNKHLRHYKLLRKEWSHPTDPTANFIKKLFVTSCDNLGNQIYFYCSGNKKEKRNHREKSQFTYWPFLKKRLFYRILPFLWCITTMNKKTFRII